MKCRFFQLSLLFIREAPASFIPSPQHPKLSKGGINLSLGGGDKRSRRLRSKKII
jgi:hypothetical protein